MNWNFRFAARFSLHRLSVFCLVLLLSGLVSCGGGSSGSGVLPITGLARTIDGEPIVGLEVSVQTQLSEGQGVTDENGAVSLEAFLDQTNTILFEFRRDELQAEDILENVPEDAINIIVEWTFDQGQVSTKVTYEFAERDPEVLVF